MVGLRFASTELSDLRLPVPRLPAELDKLVVEQTEKWDRVIRAANIKAE